MPPELVLRIAEKSGRNLRKAMLMFEACKAQQYPFAAKQEIRIADWEVGVLHATAYASPLRVALFVLSLHEATFTNMRALVYSGVYCKPRERHFERTEPCKAQRGLLAHSSEPVFDALNMLL